MKESEQVFYISIASIAVGMILACMKYGYKSKCSEVKLGCITIKRDVVIENNYDVTHPIEEDEGKENKV
jgi:hypothetical protein